MFCTDISNKTNKGRKINVYTMHISITCAYIYHVCIYLSHVHISITCAYIYHMCIYLSHVHISITCAYHRTGVRYRTGAGNYVIHTNSIKPGGAVVTVNDSHMCHSLPSSPLSYITYMYIVHCVSSYVHSHSYPG